MNFPSQFTNGDTVTFVTSLTNYPSSDFVLNWSIRGENSLDITAVAEGTAFKTTITGAQSATLTQGDYQWVAQVTNQQGERLTIARGQTKVLADLSAISGAYNPLSLLEQELVKVREAIQLVYQGQEYKIHDRELKRAYLPDLIKREKDLIWQIEQEKRRAKIANGYPDPNRVQVKFT